jgi:Acetyltransferase (GNAT) domain
MKLALELEGYWVDAYQCFGNWHLAVNNRSYAEYEVSIPSRLRNTIKRNRKKLSAAGTWTVEVINQPGPELERGITAWQAVYDKSWKVPEPFPHFVPGLIRMCAQQGWLRLGVLRLGELPIAAQLWIIKDGYALIYKLAYDEDYKQYSAGSALSAELMRRALDEDRTVDVDYLTGDDGYKVDWMSHRRQRMGLVAFDRRSAQGLISFAKQRLGQAWRRWSAPAVPAQNASLSASQPSASTTETVTDPKA